MLDSESATQHWQNVYRTKAVNQVSWYQSDCQLSTQLINQHCNHHQGIIDVGSGASLLLSELLDAGFQDITALDISNAALEVSQKQLGCRATKVNWLQADICHSTFARTFALWHDRAVFHFMTPPEQQQLYKQTLLSATKKYSTVIISTFAPGGPEKCSNLAIKQHSLETISALFCPDFDVLECIQESHMTPWNTEQAFHYFVLKRV